MIITGNKYGTTTAAQPTTVARTWIQTGWSAETGQPEKQNRGRFVLHPALCHSVKCRNSHLPKKHVFFSCTEMKNLSEEIRARSSKVVVHIFSYCL